MRNSKAVTHHELTYFVVLTKLKKSGYFDTNRSVMKTRHQQQEPLNYNPGNDRSKRISSSLSERIAHDIQRPSFFDPKEYEKEELSTILDHLKKSHTYYLSKKLPEIEQQMMHLYSKFPEYRLFKVLYLFFQDYKGHLIDHIEQEEKTVFTYVSALLRSEKPSNEERMLLLQGSPSLNDFLEEHTDTEQDLSAMRKILKSDASYKQLHPISMLLHQLSSLENHLNIHARIEDEVFVPKALTLEKEILNA